MATPHGPSHAPTPRTKLDCIDGLRGLAIAMVILFHLDVHRAAAFPPGVDAFLKRFWFGYSGVHLFLVLSGYCLTRSLLGRAASGRGVDWKAYARARGRRIAPPYYASMALVLLIPLVRLALGRPGAAEGDDLSFRQVVSHLTFTHGFSDRTLYGIDPPYWSLSLEAQFYVLLPLLWYGSARWGVARVVAVVAIASAAYRAAVAAYLPGSAAAANGVFPGRLTEFALGVAVAFAERRGAGRVATPAIFAGAVGLLGLATLCEARGHGAPADFAYGAGYACLLLAVVRSAEGRGAIARAFEFRPLVALGTISYSVYLMHVPIMATASVLWYRAFPRPDEAMGWCLVVYLVVAIVLGSFAFFLAVERHFLRSAGGLRLPRAPASPLAPAPAPLPGGEA